MILTWLLASLAFVSLGLMIWQVVVAARFPIHQRRQEEYPAERGRAAGSPPVTILKPLKGCDTLSEECLRSWLTQDYDGHVQILFGVASSSDPACELVRKVLAGCPERMARLVICSEQPGNNAKVSQLIQLETLVKHEILCVSDADVWVPPDYLSDAIARLQDPGVGLVNSLYRIGTCSGFGMRWEAFAVNADFWSQVLQSLSLRPMDFGLGAAFVTHRRHLEGIGGFSAVAHYLADDYEVGNRMAQNRVRLSLSPVVVECRTDSRTMTFSHVWQHQLRWARTIRACRPKSFACTIFSNTTLWPLLWLGVSPSPVSLAGCGVCVGFRFFAGHFLEQRMTSRFQFSSGFMALVKDFLSIWIWAAAFAGNAVRWSGIDYKVDPAGKLQRIEALVDGGIVDGTPDPH